MTQATTLRIVDATMSEGAEGMSRERPLAWRRSRRCGSNACVEVAYDGRFVYLRSSQNPSGNHLRFTPEDWVAFLGWVTTIDVPGEQAATKVP